MKRDRVVRPRTRPKAEDVIDTDRAAVKQAIRGARKRAGLTQEQAAAKRGYATSTISHWESGLLPKTWDELSRYAHALGQAIVLRFGPDTDEEPPPDWAGAMEKRIVSEVRANRVMLMDALAAGFAEQAERELDEGNDDGEPDETSDQPPEGAGPQPSPAS